MDTKYIIGFNIGIWLGVFLNWLGMRSYRNILVMCAKEGRYEKINGKWYEIKEIINEEEKYI